MTKYVRVENVVYEEDDTGKRQVFHESPSISKARKWVKEHRAKGLDIRVEEPPQKSPQKLRQDEIAALTRAQHVDQKQSRSEGPRPYVMPDKDSSSSSRNRGPRPRRSSSPKSGRRGFGST